MPSVPSPEPLLKICRDLGCEIQALAVTQAAGRISESEFVSALLRLEVEKAAPHGLTLTASHTFDDWTVVSLRHRGHSEPCSSFEFQPKTGEFRVLGTPGRGADPAPRGQLIE